MHGMVEAEGDLKFFKDKPFGSEKRTTLVPEKTRIANIVVNAILIGEPEHIGETLNYVNSSPDIKSTRDRAQLRKIVAYASVIGLKIQQVPLVGVAVESALFTDDGFEEFAIAVRTKSGIEYMEGIGMKRIDKDLEEVKESGMRAVINLPVIPRIDGQHDILLSENTSGLVAAQFSED